MCGMWSLLLQFLLIAVTVNFCQSDQCLVRRKLTVSQNGSDSGACTNSATPSSPPPSCRTLGYLISKVSSCANITILDDITLSNLLYFNKSSSKLLITGNILGRRIKCQNSSGFFFDSSRQISIESLSFIGCAVNVTMLIDCEAKRGIFPLQLSSITFYRAQEVEIVSCTFGENIGSSLLLIDVNGTAIQHSNFSGASHEKEIRSGGIVLRRLLSHGGDYNYSITNCLFKDIQNVPGNASCPNNTYLAPDEFIRGGGIDINLVTNTSSTNITITNSKFFNNRADFGGAVSMAFSGIVSGHTINLIGSTFENNTACTKGGAVSVLVDYILPFYNESNFGHVFVDSCAFENNRAYYGGGLALSRCQDCGNISLTASRSNWTHNNAYSGSYALAIGGNITDTDYVNPYIVKEYYAKASVTDCEFRNNTNVDYIYYQNTNAVGALGITGCELNMSGNVLFEFNRGTALFLKDLSKVTLAGNVTFESNFGIYGGAINSLYGSTIWIDSTANVRFIRNNAVVIGGAVYSKPILEWYGSTTAPCLFHLVESASSHINVTFEGNKASFSNQSVYIGNPDKCNNTLLLKAFKYDPDTKDQVQTSPKSISFTTTPKQINNTLCIMLGERFFLNPSVTDLFGHNTSSFGYLTFWKYYDDEFSIMNNYVLVGPSAIGVNKYTMNDVFYIKGLKTSKSSKFMIEFIYEQMYTYRSGSTLIGVELVPCKFGYYYSPMSQTCECVKENKLTCLRNDTTVCIEKGYWYDNESETTIACSANNCNYSNGNCLECPTVSDYCVITSSNDVCWEGRGGYLCSKCADGYSFNFGAYSCKNSSTCELKRHAFLILFAVLSYGIVFIVVLLLILTLNLSEGTGFMYGLVYYFSVITLFISSLNQLVLRLFTNLAISMTQLDPRILLEFLPFCFIQGMDSALHHLMLQYITPFFIIGVFLVIFWFSRTRCCRCPKRISLAENSPNHAICLLILFSYTSLCHTNFQILRPIVINDRTYVHAAPDVIYFDATKHLPYALFALAVEFLISLPICLLLLLEPCLSRKINLVRLRLKPIVDEFQASYHPECRWFAGFYFLARQLMYLVSIIPQEDLPQANLALQGLCVCILLIHTSFQPYKKKWLNVLDTIFLVDIQLFSIYASFVADPPEFTELNSFLYNAIPYVLILIPLCYLLLVITVLLLRRLFHCLKNTRFIRERNILHTNSSLKFDVGGLSSNSEESHSTSEVTTDYFTRDREPLLADFDERLIEGQAKTTSRRFLHLRPPWDTSTNHNYGAMTD